MEINYEKAALIFKALSDPNRLAVINMIKNEEKCACKLLVDLNITQPTLSHHMKTLCDADLVNQRRDGKWMHYSINHENFDNIKNLLTEFSNDEI